MDNLELQIERMGYGPFGIAHDKSGKIIFVEGGVTQDFARVQITQEKKSYSRARVKEILKPSPFRAKNIPAFAKETGADWADLSYDAQLQEKQACVREALIRVGKMDAEALDKILKPVSPAQMPWHYRNKIEMAAFKDPSGRFALGFYSEGSANPIAADAAPLASKPAARSPKALRGAIRRLQGSSDLGIYRVGVRASEKTGDVQVALWTPPSAFPRSQAASLMQSAIQATSVVRLVAKHDSARRVKSAEALTKNPKWHEVLETPVGNIDFLVSAESFFQVNTNQAQVLIKKVFEALGGGPALSANPYIADLYCGCGTFTCALAKAGADVIGVELAGSSTRDLAKNLSKNKLDAQVICDDVSRVIADLEGLDAAVFDPPRAGLDARIIDAIAQMDAPPSQIVYVSCDPQTLARDTHLLRAAGYAAVSVCPVDMFPQTFHIECVATFAKINKVIDENNH